MHNTGVVTAVAIQCAPKPASVQVAFLQCPSFAAVQAVLAHAKRHLGEILSAAEFLDSPSLQLATTLLPGVANPLAPTPAAADTTTSSSSGGASLSEGCPMYMVIETQGSNARHDREKLESFMEVRAGWLCVCVCPCLCRCVSYTAVTLPCCPNPLGADVP